jgi:hypothetical protein
MKHLLCRILGHKWGWSPLWLTWHCDRCGRL